MLIVSCICVCGIGDLGFAGRGGSAGTGLGEWGVWMVRRGEGRGRGGEWSGGKEWKRREGKWGRGNLGKGEEE